MRQRAAPAALVDAVKKIVTRAGGEHHGSARFSDTFPRLRPRSDCAHDAIARSRFHHGKAARSFPPATGVAARHRRLDRRATNIVVPSVWNFFRGATPARLMRWGGEEN